jgi:hypothetical protein
MDQLHGKGVWRRSVRSPSENGRGVGGRAPADAEQPVGEAIGLATCVTVAPDQLSEASQILDQHDLQRDRGGPEFADRQRLDQLICNRSTARANTSSTRPPGE